ncbi:hypothetical protein ADUPG1_000734, partial [Aduncisulcus paluster]
ADMLHVVLDDIANQTYPNFNINIFEDGSTDNSDQIASEFAAKHPRCKVFRNRVNLGLVRNFNRALQHGDADYVMFKSGNDRLKPTFVEQVAEMLRANPSLGVAYARARPLSENGTTPPRSPKSIIFEQIVKMCSRRHLRSCTSMHWLHLYGVSTVVKFWKSAGHTHMLSVVIIY